MLYILQVIHQSRLAQLFIMFCRTSYTATVIVNLVLCILLPEDDHLVVETCSRLTPPIKPNKYLC